MELPIQAPNNRRQKHCASKNKHPEIIFTVLNLAGHGVGKAKKQQRWNDHDASPTNSQKTNQ